MDIHEYQAKELLGRHGIRLPRGGLAYSPEQAAYRASEIGGEAWVVKAQVHSGGRNEAGGIVLCHSDKDVAAAAERLLGRRLKAGGGSKPVNRLYVEEAVTPDQAHYLGFALDRRAERIVIVASSSGGMEIGEIVAREPDSVIRCAVDPGLGLQNFQAREIAFGLGLDRALITKAVDVIKGCFRVFCAHDAEMLEINPLAVARGDLIALDCKMSFDDQALFRRPEISELRDKSQEDRNQTFATDRGLSYTGLEGDIGCIVNGRGLATATRDMIRRHGGAPANVLEIGGGAGAERVAKSFRAVLADKRVKAILVNVFAGINRCDWIAEGVLKALGDSRCDLPVIVRLAGTEAHAGKDILARHAPQITLCDALDEAAEVAVAQWKRAARPAA